MEIGKKIWVFGYGSLVWKPGFKYADSKIGFIKGFERRFWQGNTAQRGTPSNPGRVATLVESPKGKTWGRAFQLNEVDTVTSLSYLDNREKTLGGYTSVVTTFQTKDTNEVLQVLVYVATPHNEHFLGPAPLHEIAEEVIQAHGTCGHNVEYVLRLADYFKNCLPEGFDRHLLNLEKHIRTKLNVGDDHDVDSVLCMLDDVQETFCTNQESTDERMRESGKQTGAQSQSGAFSSRIPSRSLKCVSV